MARVAVQDPGDLASTDTVGGRWWPLPQSEVKVLAPHSAFSETPFQGLVEGAHYTERVNVCAAHSAFFHDIWLEQAVSSKLFLTYWVIPFLTFGPERTGFHSFTIFFNLCTFII
jgi:hypothetical protein